VKRQHKRLVWVALVVLVGWLAWTMLLVPADLAQ
jgi:hypothetical protein